MIGKIAICLMLGYLFGCFSTAYVVGKLNKIDIRKYGSGNSGTTNALRTLGPKAGAITLIGDVFKAIIPILFVRFFFFPNTDANPLFTLYVGLGVVLGHNYPFWLKFKGGKGAAATGGVMIAFDPMIIPFGLILLVSSVAITKYVSVGSLLVTTLFPVWIFIKYPNDLHMLIVALLFTASAFFKHRSNIKRIFNGTENKIGQRIKVDK